MHDNTTSSPAELSYRNLLEERQVKAMLHLVRDLGYEVKASDAGDWTICQRTDLGESTVVGVDTAREVVDAARTLANALQVDRKNTLLHCAE
jgi:hypothetical protein